MVTADVCKQHHEVVIPRHHTRRQVPLDTLPRGGETWEAGTEAGGAPADLDEREAVLVCCRSIRFETAVPGCTIDSLSQGDRLPSFSPSFRLYSDVPWQPASSGCRGSSLGSLSKVSRVASDVSYFPPHVICAWSLSIFGSVAPIIPCHRRPCLYCYLQS